MEVHSKLWRAPVRSGVANINNYESEGRTFESFRARQNFLKQLRFLSETAKILFGCQPKQDIDRTDDRKSPALGATKIQDILNQVAESPPLKRADLAQFDRSIDRNMQSAPSDGRERHRVSAQMPPCIRC